MSSNKGSGDKAPRQSRQSPSNGQKKQQRNQNQLVQRSNTQQRTQNSSTQAEQFKCKVGYRNQIVVVVIYQHNSSSQVL